MNELIETYFKCVRCCKRFDRSSSRGRVVRQCDECQANAVSVLELVRPIPWPEWNGDWT